MSSMKQLRPRNILLCGSIPLDQCLCDRCENCEQVLKCFHSIGLTDIPKNRYCAVDSVVCSSCVQLTFSKFPFPRKECISGTCTQCGEFLLGRWIRSSNDIFFAENKRLTWHKCVSKEGKSAHEKCQIKGTANQALSDLLEMLKSLKSHMFRSNWHRSLFEYKQRNLESGEILQIFDFAMNFRNMYQDEVQSMYYDETQTAIHAVINYFICPNEGCNEVVSLTLAQISADKMHDSFVAHAAHNATFRYLAELGLANGLNYTIL